MSPKFYGFLWTLVIAAALVTWLAGMFTMFTVVVFGFIVFGMTFMGMMCVLPGAVSHPHAGTKAEAPAKPRAIRSNDNQMKHHSGSYTTFRSA